MGSNGYNQLYRIRYGKSELHLLRYRNSFARVEHKTQKWGVHYILCLMRRNIWLLEMVHSPLLQLAAAKEGKYKCCPTDSTNSKGRACGWGWEIGYICHVLSGTCMRLPWSNTEETKYLTGIIWTGKAHDIREFNGLFDGKHATA